MSYVLLFAASGIFYFLAWRQWKKNWNELKKRNASEESAYKRVLNYPYHLIWPGYLWVFATGLILNNLVISP